ncbi:MAG: hypothetical protein OJF49_001155 [Ktedonobacterales bacterium]|nr:MAG: hypothetical protein OJF49_001155 [Ktedonobacterales bacterium]
MRFHSATIPSMGFPRSIALRNLLLLAIVGASIVLAGCSGSSGTPKRGVGAFLHVLVFAPQVTYADALRRVTDFGLQPAWNCGVPATVVPSSGQAPLRRWEPVGQRATYDQQHEIVVQETPLAPSDWQDRLTSLPGVRQVNIFDVPACQNYVNGTPTANDALPLTGNDMIPYGLVTFDSTTSYDDALYTVSDLGLNLADPCGSRSGDFNIAGQEDGLAQTHTLLIAPDPGNSSTLWQQQLQSAAGVTKTQIPAGPPSCSG